MGRIIYGNQNFGYAPISRSENAYSFGNPVFLKGMVSAEAEVEENTTSIYADNIPFCVVAGAKVRTLTATLKWVSDAYATFLGFKQSENGMLTDTGEKPNHCVFFESMEQDCETGEVTRTLHYFYNVKATEPTLETNTVEEEIESADLEIEYNATPSPFVVDEDGNAVSYGKITRTEENKALYDTFLSAVILPTSAIPSGQ